MTLRVAIQMDPIEGIDINADTSFALAEEAQARGAKLWVYGPGHLTYEAGKVQARARPATVQRIEGQPAILGEETSIDLGADTDVILVRQDPPFDMAYITAAHVLDLIRDDTLILNDPASIISSPEKLFPLLFPELMPTTLISRDMTAISAFRARHEDIILKPLYGNGGAGVFRVRPDDSNFASIMEMFLERSREPVMAQAFLPAVKDGDKRIFIIDGELAGGFNRRPLAGQTRSNLHVGGTAEPTELSDADIHICNMIGPELKKRGLVLAGIDVIGGKLTEVNVTSPTGVQELKRFTGIDVASLFWDSVQRKLETR